MYRSDSSAAAAAEFFPCGDPAVVAPAASVLIVELHDSRSRGGISGGGGGGTVARDRLQLVSRV